VGKPETGLPDGKTKHLALDLKSPVGKRRLLVTSNGHGVFESQDGGQRWRSINGDLPAEAAKEPRGLALDPKDSNHIVLACGGTVAFGAGVYETRDGGLTWRRVSEGLNVGEIQALVVDPSDFSTFYLCVRELYDRKCSPPVPRPGGLFKSADGGATWKHALQYHFVTSAAVSPANPQVIYVGTTDHPYHDDYMAEGVLKSADGGLTWRKENTGMSIRQVSAIRVSPLDPSLVFVSTGGNSVFIGKDKVEQASRLPAPR